MELRAGFENFDDRMEHYSKVLENTRGIKVIDRCEPGIYKSIFNNGIWVTKFDIFEDNATGLEYQNMMDLGSQGMPFIQEAKLIQLQDVFSNENLEAIMKKWIPGEDLFTGDDINKVLPDEEYMKAKAQVENQAIMLHNGKFANLDVKEGNIIKTPRGNFTLFDHNSYVRMNPQRMEDFYRLILMDMLDIKETLYTIDEPDLKGYAGEMRRKNPLYSPRLEEMANEVESISAKERQNIKNEVIKSEARQYIYKNKKILVS